MQKQKFDEFAIANRYFSRGEGKTEMQFLLDRPTRSWVRLDRVKGVELLSVATFIEPARAARYRSADRHSETRVNIELSPGDVLAVMNRGGKRAIAVFQVQEREGGDGLYQQELEFSHVRNPAGGWDIKLKDEAGKTREVLPSLRQGGA